MLLADYMIIGMIVGVSVFSIGILMVLNRPRRDEKPSSMV